MRQGDLRAAATPWPTPCWAGSDVDGQLQLDELRHLRRRAARASTRSSSSPAAPPPTPAWSPSTPSSTGRRIPVEVELAHEFRYRDPILDAQHAGRRDQPVRRDHGHADGGPARPRAGRQGCSRSATPTARPSRASPTRCSTPTPARRSRSPRPRRSSPRSPPATCSASTSRRCAAPSYGDEIKRRSSPS